MSDPSKLRASEQSSQKRGAMQLPATPLPEWRRSTRCGTGSCIEVAKLASTIGVRDSKDPEGGQLEFDHRVWKEFLEFLKTPGQ